MVGVYSRVCDTYTDTYIEHQDMVTKKIMRNAIHTLDTDFGAAIELCRDRKSKSMGLVRMCLYIYK